jgi:carboxymethylenebutenolidase
VKLQHASVHLSVALLASAASCKSTERHVSQPPISEPDATPLDTALLTLTPDLVTFQSDGKELTAFLYRPLGSGPFPAVVFNHGSEPLPGWAPDQAEFYVRHGFVLLVPHRRGQGRSREAGDYILDVWESTHDPDRLVGQLVAQVDDVMAAVEYIRSRPFVDPSRVAVAGCSYGGIESLLAAERGNGLVAAVDFSGAAMAWGQLTPLRSRLRLAARNAKIPVLFIQSEDDFDTAPSTSLNAEMLDAGKPTQLHIFASRGQSHEDGHAFCAGGTSPPWGDDVLLFLGSAMRLRH